MDKPKVVYYRESALQSAISDIVTFGILAAITTINFKYWGGHWYVTIFIMVAWFTAVLSIANQKVNRYYSFDAAIEALQKLKAEEDAKK